MTSRHQCNELRIPHKEYEVPHEWNIGMEYFSWCTYLSELSAYRLQPRVYRKSRLEHATPRQVAGKDMILLVRI